MKNKALKYYLLRLLFLTVLVVCNLVFAQDYLVSSNFCDEALALNKESETLRSKDPMLALEKAQKALQLAKEFACTEMEALATRYIGIVHFLTGSYDSANHYYNRSLLISQSIHDTSGVAAAYRNLAYVLQQQGNFDDATNYYNISIELFRKIGDLDGIATTQNNLSHIY